MAHCFVNNIVLNGEVVNTMESRSTVVSLVNSIVPDIRLCHSANHMEMEWIASKFESLTDVKELTIFDLSHNRLITR